MTWRLRFLERWGWAVLMLVALLGMTLARDGGLMAQEVDAEGRSKIGAEDPAVERVRKVLNAAGDLARAQGMTQAARAGEFVKSGVYEEMDGRRPVWWVWLNEASDLPEAGAVVKGARKPRSLHANLCRDGSEVYEIMCLPPDEPRELPHQPVWSKEEAVRMGGLFLALLQGEAGARWHLKVSEVEYHQQVNARYKGARFTGGVWRLSYDRHTAAGYPVFKDRVSLKLHEKYGLVFYEDNCVTRLAGVEENRASPPKLTEAQARTVALPWARKVLGVAEGDDKVTKGANTGFNLKPDSMRLVLMVVQPNNLRPGLGLGTLKPEGLAVLCWVAGFSVTNVPLNLAPGGLLIYIDADTGAYRGGAG